MSTDNITEEDSHAYNTSLVSRHDKYLLENAPELKPLIEKYAPCTMQPENEERYFKTLVRGLISQQVPPDVVKDICQKMHHHFDSITPEKILQASDSELGLP